MLQVSVGRIALILQYKDTNSTPNPELVILAPFHISQNLDPDFNMPTLIRTSNQCVVVKAEVCHTHLISRVELILSRTSGLSSMHNTIASLGTARYAADHKSKRERKQHEQSHTWSTQMMTNSWSTCMLFTTHHSSGKQSRPCIRGQNHTLGKTGDLTTTRCSAPNWGTTTSTGPSWRESFRDWFEWSHRAIAGRRGRRFW